MRKLLALAFVALAACGGGGGGGGGGGTVDTPVLSPAGGTFSTKPSVTITCATSGAVIYYTTDGTAPTATSPVYSAAIPITTTATVKAYATASGKTDSAVASATYTLQAGAPAYSPAAGTYATAQNVTITSATPGATIHYTTDGSTPTASSATYSTPVPLALNASPTTTTLKAIALAAGFQDSAVASGTYVISASATPAAQPTFSVGSGTYTAAQSVTITTATAGASIYYTTDGSTPTATSTLYAGPVAVASSLTLKAIASGNGHTASTVASATYVINLPKAAAPTFSPAAGAVTSGTSIAMSSTTPGAAIYYTTNGTTPTTASTHYTGPVSVTSATTFKAIATATGYADSDVATASYTITTGGGTDFATACPGYNTAFFNLWATCLKVNPDYLPSSIYASLGANCSEMQKEINAGLIAYDRVQGQACLSALQAFTCSSVYATGGLPEPSSCAAAITGTVANGGNCYSGNDCSNGYCDETGSNCPGKCHAYAGLGANCSSTLCADGLSCDYSANPKICKADGATVGSACPCSGNLWCGSDGKCAAPLTANANCNASDNSCAVGLVCLGSPSKCQALAGPDGPCTPGASPTDDTVCGELGTGYWCNPATNHCVSFPKVTELCKVLPYCIGSYCDDVTTPASPTCKAKLADGATCRYTDFFGQDCLSGSCSSTTNKCVARPTPLICTMP